MNHEQLAASAPMSQRAYARHRGVALSTVQKAIESGRIRTNADGKIDPAQADAEWERNTASKLETKRSLRRVPSPALRREPSASAEGLGGGNSYATARAVKEQFLARLVKIEYEERTGKLLSRDEVWVERFNANRIIRDGMQNLADRVCGAITAEIAAAIAAAGLPAEIAQRLDLTKVHTIISTEVRQVLGDTSDDLNRQAGSF